MAPETKTPSNNLWVGNLSSEVTDSDLKDLFSIYGNVHSVTTPNPSRNYAFVYFNRNEDAKEAMKGLRGCVLRGNEIMIDFARPVVKHVGELPNLPEFYKSTHYNGDKDQWIAPECQTNYEKMKQIEAEHNQAGAIPLTQEELSIAVLKKRPGDVKGLGLRPSSSIRTICESATIKEYVTRLEKKLEEPDETIEKLLEANKQQQVFNASMMEFLIEKGYAGHLGSGGLSSNG